MAASIAVQKAVSSGVDQMRRAGHPVAVMHYAGNPAVSLTGLLSVAVRIAQPQSTIAAGQPATPPATTTASRGEY